MASGLELFCGDAACKARVPPDAPLDLPIVCPACGAALLPEDELATRPRSVREAKRAILMQESPAGRVAVRSAAELDLPGPDTDARIDALLERVSIEPERFGSRGAIYLTIGLVALLVFGIVVLWVLY